MNALEYFRLMPELLKGLEAALPSFREFCLKSKMARCRAHFFVGSVLDNLWCDKTKKRFWCELDFGDNRKAVIIELPYSILKLK